MTRKLTRVIPLNANRFERKIEATNNTSTTLPGFHNLQSVQGNQIWLVFDSKPKREDVYIEL